MHNSAHLVEWVARACGLNFAAWIDINLGRKSLQYKKRKQACTSRCDNSAQHLPLVLRLTISQCDKSAQHLPLVLTFTTSSTPCCFSRLIRSAWLVLSTPRSFLISTTCCD